MDENNNSNNNFITNTDTNPAMSEGDNESHGFAQEDEHTFREDILIETESKPETGNDIHNSEDELAQNPDKTSDVGYSAESGFTNDKRKNEQKQNSYEYSWLKNDMQREHVEHNLNDQTDRNRNFYSENNQSGFSGLNQKQKSGYNNYADSKNKNTFGKMIAMAVVFGLIAGLISFGVNFAGARLTGTKQSVVTAPKIATTETTDNSQSLDEELDKTTHNESVTDSSKGAVAEVAKNSLPALTTISVMSVQEMESFFGMTESYEVEGAGTGVIVGQNDSELLIATNNHVVEDATKVTVGFVDEQVTEAFVKGTDPENDLAVVGVKLENIPEETMQKIKIATIGNSDGLQLGEQVVAIGNALGFGQSVTSGYISGLDRELELTDGSNTFTSTGLIQTDAAINSGNSGGALLNMNGELIGINEAKSSSSEFGASVDNVAYAIPISKAEPILQELMNLETKEKVADDERGYLGVTCADVNQETSERYNIPVGVYVREVVENGPAAECGILVGDVITKFDGRIVNSYEKLVEALSYCKVGEEVEIIIQRSESGKYTEKTLTVKLGEASVLDKLSIDEKPRTSNKPNIQIGN